MNIATKAYRKFESRMIDIIGLVGFGGGMILGNCVIRAIQHWPHILLSSATAIVATGAFIKLALMLSKALQRTYDRFNRSGQNTSAIEFKNPPSCCMTFFGVLFAMGIMGAVIIRATNNFRNTMMVWLMLGGFYLAIIVGLILLFRSVKKSHLEIFQDTAGS